MKAKACAMLGKDAIFGQLMRFLVNWCDWWSIEAIFGIALPLYFHYHDGRIWKRKLALCFPLKMSVDSVLLQAEIHNFVSYVDLTKTKLESLAEAAKFLWVCKSAFPLRNGAFRLLMTAPVTPSQDDRTFSRLKIIKTYLRTTMTGERLESLMMLSCECCVDRKC